MSTWDDLKKVMENLRAEKYKKIDASLVSCILEIEKDTIDSRFDSQRNIDQLVEKNLSKEE